MARTRTVPTITDSSSLHQPKLQLQQKFISLRVGNYALDVTSTFPKSLQALRRVSQSTLIATVISLLFLTIRPSLRSTFFRAVPRLVVVSFLTKILSHLSRVTICRLISLLYLITESQHRRLPVHVTLSVDYSPSRYSFIIVAVLEFYRCLVQSLNASVKDLH